MTISTEKSLQILNTQYAVFFGVIFSLSFYLDRSAEATYPSIQLAVAPANWLPFSLMVIYYIFDWFTANVVPERLRSFTFLELLAYVVGVVFLGSVVVLTNGDPWRAFLVFGLYGVLVGFYDISVVARLDSHSVQVVLGYLGAGWRVALAVAMALIAGVSLLRGDVASVVSNNHLALWLLLLLVCLKLLRLRALVRAAK